MSQSNQIERINRIRASGETLYEAQLRVAVADSMLHNYKEEQTEVSARMAAFEKAHLPAHGPVSIGSYRKRKK